MTELVKSEKFAEFEDALAKREFYIKSITETDLTFRCFCNQFDLLFEQKNWDYEKEKWNVQTEHYFVLVEAGAGGRSVEIGEFLPGKQ